MYLDIEGNVTTNSQILALRYLQNLLYVQSVDGQVEVALASPGQRAVDHHRHWVVVRTDDLEAIDRQGRSVPGHPARSGKIPEELIDLNRRLYQVDLTPNGIELKVAHRSVLLPLPPHELDTALTSKLEHVRLETTALKYAIPPSDALRACPDLPLACCRRQACRGKKDAHRIDLISLVG